jgi:hypothetical protein
MFMGTMWRAARVASCTRRAVNNKGPMLTKRASGRSRTNVAKAALISRLLLAWGTGMLGKPHAILNPLHLGERHVDRLAEANPAIQAALAKAHNSS